MENLTNQNEKNIIVTFHIGRGGRFNNAGHTQFLDDNNSAKSSVENSNFLGFENESDIIEEHGDDVLDLISDLNNDDTSSEYKEFCKKYGDLGGVVVKGPSGEIIGDYVADGEPFHYDYDGQYDTTYGVEIEDCDEDQIEMIVKSDRFKSSELIDWINENTDYNLDTYGYLVEEIED